MNFICLAFTVLALHLQNVSSKLNTKHIIYVDNIKAYKKVLKTHTNVLTVYSKDDKSVTGLFKWLDNTAKEVKGKGTIVHINCGENKDSKKLCKKYSISPSPKVLKHYKDGNFHKNYDRKENEKSMLNFMLDPTGDQPWEEDPIGKSVLHVSSEKELNKLRQKEKGQLLIMFYAPWCGFCKKMKPDYANAATELKGKAVLAAMDVDKPDAHNVRYQFNITGFPTLIYFDKGKQIMNYNGKNDKAGIIKWLEDPYAKAEAAPEGEVWDAPEILHLTDATFDEKLAEKNSTVVMFYAPWCGHCKKMKPEFVNAAKLIKIENLETTLAAVDCTVSNAVCKKFGVTGYPTVKYFSDSEKRFDVNIRSVEEIVDFAKNPQEPPPPPPPEMPWAETSADLVLHLSEADFKEELKKTKHVLVMFYAPWCGHCKSAKPEVETAAEHFKDDRKVAFAGVDCIQHATLCKTYDVAGYPTFRYFLYGKKDFAYKGGRTSDAFIAFMKNPGEQDKPDKSRSVEPEWSETESSVVHLSTGDFKDYVHKNPSVLVMFYAPWCGHCKALKPAYTQAADEMLYHNHALAAVDCTKSREVCGDHGISGYPTLKHFSRNGEKITEYEGGRTKEEVIAFLKGMNIGVDREPTYKNEHWEKEHVAHLDDFSFDQYLNTKPSVFVMFYAPWCGHCKRMKPDWEELAKSANIDNTITGNVAAVNCVDNRDLCKRFDVAGYPMLKHFSYGKKVTDYKGGRSLEAFKEFLKNPKPAEEKKAEPSWEEGDNNVDHLTDDTFEKYMAQHDSTIVMFYAPWCGHCKRLKPDYEKAATAINVEKQASGTVAALDCTKHKNIAKPFDIKGYPTLLYFKDGINIEKYQKGRNANDIIKYMKNPPTGASEGQDWSSEKSAVVHLTEQNFVDGLAKNDVTLVMFYAPWCGHCKTLKPVYTEAANQLEKEEFPGTIAAVDATKAADLATKEQVTGYPTLRLYNKGEFVEKYQGGRTKDALLGYVKKQIEGTDRQEASIDREAWEKILSSVTHLTPETFQKYVTDTRYALITFHQKWCPNCNNLRSHMMSSASRLSADPAFGIAALNCDTHKDKCEELGITSYPAIKFYNHGYFVENYSGVSTATEIVNYLQKKVKVEL